MSTTVTTSTTMYKRRKDEDPSPAQKNLNVHTSSIFDLYRSPTFDESIRKAEYRTYTPFIKSFNCNDVVEFSINQVDSFFAMNTSLLAIKGKVEVAGQGNVSLAPNFGAFLFDSCTYSESAREVETVRDPGIVSAIRAYTCYGKEDSNYMAIAGWNYPSSPILASHDKSFSLLMPLKHIFNIFNDYSMITCGRQTLKLVRARNDNDCIIIREKSGTNATTGTTAKITIDSIELKIKHIYPSDDVKEHLLKAIETDEPILIPFRKWELNELPAISTGARREIWAVKHSTAIERPRFIIVCFQTDKRDAVEADPTLMDHVNTISVRVSLNGDYYPNERMQLDFPNNHYTEAHFNYSEFLGSYANIAAKKCLLDYAAFKNRALFVIDCSKQEETMKSSSVDVKLDIETDIGFPANTKAYCIIIHDCLLEYFPLSEVIKNIS